MTRVVVAVNWGDAAVKVFSTSSAAERHLRAQGLRSFPDNVWAASVGAVEQGEYWSTSEQACLEAGGAELPRRG